MGRIIVGSAFARGETSVNMNLSTRLFRDPEEVVTDFEQSSWNVQFIRNAQKQREQAPKGD